MVTAVGKEGSAVDASDVPVRANTKYHHCHQQIIFRFRVAVGGPRVGRMALPERMAGMAEVGGRGPGPGAVGAHFTELHRSARCS